MDGKSDVAVLKEFFGLRLGTTSRDFLEELKALSPAEKAELAGLAREALGVPQQAAA